MGLMSVQRDAQQISVAISEVIGVDVVVVDDQLRRVADTFHYPDNIIPIRSSSIIGRIIESGQPVVVDNKYYYQSCVDCKDRALCSMTGFMGVPILYENKVAGAIGLVIAEHNVKHLIENVNLILGFLQQMADFLTGKMSAQVSYENMKTLSLERDSMLEASDTGIVLVDASGHIISCNQRFRGYFGSAGVELGKRLTDCIQHPLITQAIASRTAQPSRTVVIPLRDQVFYGKLSSHPMWQSEAFSGTAFAFLNLHGGDDDLTLTLTSGQETAREAVRRLLDGRNPRRALSALEAAGNREPLLIRCSSRTSRVELAAAIHRDSGRSGKLIMLDTFGHTDTEAERKLFGQEISGISPYVPSAMLLAHQGTLCICNVFLLPTFLQVRLRRYLQGEREAGAFQPDVRLLFTESPIMEEADPRFVDEEFARILRSREIWLPGPAEDRPDFLVYLEDCLTFFAARFGCARPHLTEDAKALLADSYPWTHSVRQIRQVMEYLTRTMPGQEITAQAVCAVLGASVGAPRRSIQEIEQQEIQRLLQQGNTPDEIANILQISRSTLYRRLKKYHLQTL